MEIGFFIFGITGLLTLICFLPPFAQKVKLPYSVLLAIVGTILGGFIQTQTNVPGFIEDFMITIKSFDITSDTFLMVFLPILLFETALNMNIRRLLDDWGPILVMAIIAVVVCTILVGVSLDYFSEYGLIACLLLGAIIATTDPVSVVGIFREVGAPKRLSNLVEGESLFNDAASIALYAVLLGVLTTDTDLSVQLIVSSFLSSFLGGIIAGYLFGRSACILFHWLRGYPHAEITLTITLAYLTFFVSDHYLEVSGVVATVIAGLVIGSSGRTRMSPTTFEILKNAWSQFGFWANSLIFMFAAMLIPSLMAKVTPEELWLTLLLFIVAHIARFIVVFGLLPVLSFTPMVSPIKNTYKTVMLWGGLRGAVSLALALAITEHKSISYDIRHFIGVATTGFVLLTLFVNGTSMRFLMQWLKLNQLSEIEAGVRNQVQLLALEDTQRQVMEVANMEELAPSALMQVNQVFEASLQQLHRQQMSHFSVDMREIVGLVIAAKNESELIFHALKSEMINWRTAEYLLSKTERLEDSLRNQGLLGYQQRCLREVDYTRQFHCALKVYQWFGSSVWLAKELEHRFTYLLSKRVIIQRGLEYIEQQMEPLLHSDATERILYRQAKRLYSIDNAILAMKKQYPQYALWLEENYLGRMARLLESKRYEDIRDQQLITDEVYSDLLSQHYERWSHLQKKPSLDAPIYGIDLIKNTSIFFDLPAEIQQNLSVHLTPLQLVPDQTMPINRSEIAVIYVSTGAIEIQSNEDLMLLGTGDYLLDEQMSAQSIYIKALSHSSIQLLSHLHWASIQPKV